MKYSLHNVLSETQKFEHKVSAECTQAVNEALKMIDFLQDVIVALKKSVIEEGFKSQYEEIKFFKHIKPQILAN